MGLSEVGSNLSMSSGGTLKSPVLRPGITGGVAEPPNWSPCASTLSKPMVRMVREYLSLVNASMSPFHG